MKFLIFSDLHLEFKNPFKCPSEDTGDVLILAGDIITFRNFDPLEEFLKDWNNKPILFVAGNHEYYTNKSMGKGEEKLVEFIATKKPNMTWLNNTSITFGDVEVFGGTMWTDFNNANPMAMMVASTSMNDYRIIRDNSFSRLRPEHTVKLHREYKTKLEEWLKANMGKKRVVISHHAPVVNPKTRFGSSNLMPAYNSLDMISVIEAYQPELFCYGHTHEADDHMIGNTRVVSNPYGYHNYGSVEGFDPKGLQIEI